MTDWLPSSFALYSAMVLPFKSKEEGEKLVLLFHFY